MSRQTRREHERKKRRPTQEQERDALLHAWSPSERDRLQNRARVLFAAGRNIAEIAAMLGISILECQALQKFNRDQLAFLLTDDGMREALIAELGYLQEAKTKWATKALAPTKTASEDRQALAAHKAVTEIFSQQREALTWGRALPPSTAQVEGTGVTEQELEAMAALATEDERKAILAGDERVMARLLGEVRKRIAGEAKEMRKVRR